MSPTHQFELLCSDVHPAGCRTVIRGPDKHRVIADLQLHGELAHGFEPAFYEAAHFTMLAKLTKQAPERGAGAATSDAHRP